MEKISKIYIFLLAVPDSYHTAAPHLSLVLRFKPQPGLNAAPRLQEGLALGPIRQVADEDASRVHTQEEHCLRRHLVDTSSRT